MEACRSRLELLTRLSVSTTDYNAEPVLRKRLDVECFLALLPVAWTKLIRL
jgi:hypothetical protein